MSNEKSKSVSRFKTWMTFTKQGTPENIYGDDVTIPNEGKTIRQLLLNHTRGVPIKEGLRGVFTQDIVAPTFYDLTEAEMHAERLQMAADDLKAQIEKEVEQKQQENEVEGVVKLNPKTEE